MKKWTTNEIKRLEMEYPDRQYSMEDLQKRFVRPKKSIMQKAVRLKLRRKFPTVEKTFSGYEKGFLEGFIDADGSICLRKNKKGIAPNVILSFSNNSKEILRKIQKIVGAEHLALILKKGSVNYRLSLTSTLAIGILKQITLTVKEQRRQKAIELDKCIKEYGGRSINHHMIDETYRQKISEIVKSFYAPEA